MRDLVWTLIIVWLIYKLVAMFKGAAPKKNFAYNSTNSAKSQASHSASADKDIKSAVKKSIDKEGEYVDFEEVK